MPRKGSKKSTKVSGSRKIKNLSKKVSKKSVKKSTKRVAKKTSKKSSKKTSKKSSKKTSKSLRDMTTEEMRKIIFSTESEVEQKKEQAQLSHKTYTPTYDIANAGSVNQIQPPMNAQPIQAPYLSPSNVNPSMIQPFAPTMNYNNFHGNMKSIPNYAQDYAMSPVPQNLALPNTIMSPQAPINAPGMNIPMMNMASPMSPTQMATPLNAIPQMATPLNVMPQMTSPVMNVQPNIPSVGPMSPVRVLSNGIDLSKIPNYA